LPKAAIDRNGRSDLTGAEGPSGLIAAFGSGYRILHGFKKCAHPTVTECRSNSVATPSLPPYGSTIAAKPANRLGGLIESRRTSAPTFAGAFFCARIPAL
ncbi:hypothetical protein, partial [Pseudomonas sp. NFIX28]|uniref:hypothetical protein n=1 Tax=Pseudomonas sp. NFIX28 TaxID=1566235 RepID=UPI001C491A47